jgi:hypothetical protein
VNGYVIGGYVVSIGSISVYGLSVAHRERIARRRLRRQVTAAAAIEPSPLDTLLAERAPDAEWPTALPERS